MGLFTEFTHFVAILALVSLAWVAIMIHKLDKKMNEIDQDHKHLKEMLGTLDEKLINFDLEAHILERLYDNDDELNTISDEDMSKYLKKILNKHGISEEK